MMKIVDENCGANWKRKENQPHPSPVSPRVFRDFSSAMTMVCAANVTIDVEEFPILVTRATRK